jgi:5-(carboxyamino)imidazole ribonucleotide synthase
MRAVAGLPLGDTGMAEFAAMVNFVGGLPAREEVLAIPGASLQLYGKSPRPGRKVAHVGVVAPTRAALDERLARVESIARRVNRLAPAPSEASRTA